MRFMLLEIFNSLAEREGESYLISTISTKLFFHLYPTITTEDFREYVRDERYSLKQERDSQSDPCNL